MNSSVPRGGGRGRERAFALVIVIVCGAAAFGLFGDGYAATVIIELTATATLWLRWLDYAV